MVEFLNIQIQSAKIDIAINFNFRQVMLTQGFHKKCFHLNTKTKSRGCIQKVNISKVLDPSTFVLCPFKNKLKMGMKQI